MHAPSRKNHACPPEKTMHTPLGKTMHAPPEKTMHTPPGKTMHAPPEKTMHPLGKATHAPPEQPRTPPPPVNRMTNWCKNITLPQTSFAGGNYKSSVQNNGTFIVALLLKQFCDIFMDIECVTYFRNWTT